MTLRIHLGAHKTATTELQHAFRRVRGKLIAGGLGYLGPRSLRSEALPLYTALHAGDDAAQSIAKTELNAWLARHDHHLISEENIIGTTYRAAMFGEGNILYPGAKDAVDALLALLGHPEVELFLAVRDPARFVSSAYGQQLRMGVAIDIDRYVSGLSVEELAWTELAQRLLSCEGVTRLVCWQYEYYVALRPQVIREMVGPDLAPIVPAPTWRNGGISQDAYHLFAELAMSDLDTPVEKLLNRACAEHPKTRGVPAMRPLRPRVYAASRRNYARDLEQLSRLDGVTWLARDAGDGSGADGAEPA
ncbi:hypothetical protein SAMN05421538_1087 [Paracoccus isoporae]|uniref:Sulfotransferase family protein n=1 Tax=Paracoccus isoporae TaxID=591205 RepID=A0A1G7DY24_9RHOB|nr:hypothetical protein [Paracoccus isoporae]SDE55965.1 hypothetical protein SAMN05421538_1087 [Paracoccus isoporae]